MESSNSNGYRKLWNGAIISALVAIFLAIIGRSLMEWRDFALAQERQAGLIAHQVRISQTLEKHLALIVESQKMDNEQNYEIRSLKERLQWLERRSGRDGESP